MIQGFAPGNQISDRLGVLEREFEVLELLLVFCEVQILEVDLVSALGVRAWQRNLVDVLDVLRDRQDVEFVVDSDASLAVGETE